jgi:4'-phosphopantetheinyl transferase
MKKINWEKPFTNLKFSDNEVHLWLVNLNISSQEIARLTNTLSPNEIARADRFKFEEHKNRFIAARGYLRQILSSYLQKSCCEITFKYSDRGKPKLPNTNLQFNVSHSQNIALYGFTDRNLIGIDIEYLRSNVECDKIAKRFFNEREFQIINNLLKEKKAQTFFQFWTIKEAYLKATGEGLGGGLETVEIEFNRNLEAVVKAIANSEAEAHNWFFESFIPETDFVASVAVNTKLPLDIKYYVLN